MKLAPFNKKIIWAIALFISTSHIYAGEKLNLDNPLDRICAIIGATAFSAAKGRDKGVKIEKVKIEIRRFLSRYRSQDIMRHGMEAVDFAYGYGSSMPPKELAKWVTFEWCLNYVDITKP